MVRSGSLSGPSKQQIVRPTSLLPTKLYVPDLPSGLVPRPLLVDRLREGLARRLTLISAPPGFGKSAILAEYHASAASSSVPLAWLSLDERDNDPIRFLGYVIAAVRALDSGIGAISNLGSGSRHSMEVESVLTELITETRGKPNEFALVLDDYHVIESEQIHAAVRFLLDHAPGSMHVVIVSRCDPPLPLALWRSRRQVSEFRATDLRFTSEEIQAFLNEVWRLDLSAEDMEVLEARTEGWIAGLQLAALSLQGQKDPNGLISACSGDNRYIADFLVEEVLDRQPQDVQDFLLDTSILDRLCASLCDAVTGRRDSEELLRRLEKANLFTVPLDLHRRWYRYHHIFTDFLQGWLNRESPARASALNQRASEWYEQHHLMDEAIEHALAAGDTMRAERLIEEAAVTVLWVRGEMSTYLRWLNELPKDIVRQRPRLTLYLLWSLALTGQWSMIETYLDGMRSLEPQLDATAALSESIAEPGLDSDGVLDIFTHVAAIRALSQRYRGNLDRTIEVCQQALDNLPDNDYTLRGLIGISIALAYYWGGDISEAAQAFSSARLVNQAAGNRLLAMWALYHLAVIETMRGHLHIAADICEEALREASSQSGQTFPHEGFFHVSLGDLFYEWNMIDQALDHLKHGLQLAESTGNPRMMVQANTTLARAFQAQGNWTSAQEHLQNALRLARESAGDQSTIVSGIEAKLARLSMAQGNWEAADRWAASSGLQVEGDLSFARDVEFMTLARVLIAQGRSQEALQLLTWLLPIAEKQGRMGRVIEIHMLEALAFQAKGENDNALAALDRALTLAQPERYIRLFVSEGSPMAALLFRFSKTQRRQQISEQSGSSTQYVRALLAAFNVVSNERLGASKQALAESVTERELQILRMMAAGLSNEDIARRLVLATKTVKKHLSNVYEKLNVHSRTQAIVKARELGLLG